MFDRIQYPALAAFIESVLALGKDVESIKAHIVVSISAETADLWEAAAIKYSVEVMRLIVFLSDHPEGLEMAEQMLRPLGSPAQKLSLVEKFLEDKCAEN